MNNPVYSKRKDSTQLPEVKELEVIMQKEATRPVALGKEKTHFADFTSVLSWLNFLGISKEIFEKEFTWQELVEIGSDLQAGVVSKTIKYVESGNAEFIKIIKRAASYLGEADVPQQSDILFVFGSKSLARIETAVDLYKRGFAPKIFISGGMPIYEKREQSEAQVFRAYALEHGIPEDALVVHEGAITVADNVRGGLNMLDDLGIPHNSFILVTAWFAMRRSWAMMMKYIPNGTKLYRVNAPVSPDGNFTEDGWYKNETGIKTIFNEFGKLKISEALNSS